MRVPYALRAVLWGAFWIGVMVQARTLGKPRYVGLAFLAALVATLWVQLWLPRQAHAAFAGGRFAWARRWYRLASIVAFRRQRAEHALLSRAGIAVAAQDHARAQKLLGACGALELGPAERAVLLNNQACLALDTSQSPGEALGLADAAIALRPDVPAIQHTRARALLAVGRTDDAIAVLDAMRAAGELAPRLEAERCRELATAWDAKGQAEYAADYRGRAQLVTR